MASFDTSKIVSDIKAGKITSKEPPKYIFVRNPRNNKKTKKLNPRWTAWSKRQKGKKIDKQVDKYVKDRKGPINKDLTKDNSKKKKVNTTTDKGGPVKSGVEYARSKGDDLAGFRRQKDTRITKKLKKSGFTEDRLARLRKKNAAFQKAKKGGKKAMEEYRKKYPRRG